MYIQIPSLVLSEASRIWVSTSFAFFSLCRFYLNGWAAVFNRFIFLLLNEMFY